MDNSVWLASVFGPFLAIMGLWRLVYSDNFNKVLSSIKNTIGLFFLVGMISLLVGLVVLSEYNNWSWNVGLLITLYGWVMVLRGVAVLFVPQLLMKLFSHRTFLKAWGVVPLIVGLILTWYAFAPAMTR